MPPRARALVVIIVVTCIAVCFAARSQPSPDSQPDASQAPAPASRPITMEELHRNGGVPLGWKFTLPSGDAQRGRGVYASLECYKCHAVAGESFPRLSPDPKNAGPDLTGMGPYHPAEYFAESVLNPNAVIVQGAGHTGPDGRSIMPGYADSLSVTQLVDLVAYLKSLTAGDPHGAGHSHDAPR